MIAATQHIEIDIGEVLAFTVVFVAVALSLAIYMGLCYFGKGR